jgi:hypothetical protein
VNRATTLIFSLRVLALLPLLYVGCTDTRQSQSHGREPRLISGASGPDEINLLAMGDWGNGSDRQRRTARALADYVRSSEQKFDGIILCGDNFYVKLRGVDDPQWRTLFEDMYDKGVLDFPFYAVLGNHDYESGKDVIELEYARKNPDSRFTMPSRWYRIDFPKDDPLVTVFMLDSCRDLLRRELWQAQNQWLRDQLRDRDSLGKWVICAAHHPMFSNGDHGDIGALQKTWGAVMEEHGVDFYVCGHDHDLQHLQIPNWDMSFILAGGGGAGVRPMRNDRRGPFSRSAHGFAHLRVTPEKTTVKFIDQKGNVLHAFERDADGNVRVLDTTGRDAAKPRTVKSITRPDLTTRPTTTPTTTVPAH